MTAKSAIRMAKTEEESQWILQCLQAIPVFSSLSNIKLAALVRQMFDTKFAPGEAIIKQGDMGDNFYLVCEGTVNVLVCKAKTLTTRSISLGRGAAFGEVALQYDCPRTATVLATTPVRLVALGREMFQRASSERGDASESREAVEAAFLDTVTVLRSLEPYEKGAFPPTNCHSVYFHHASLGQVC